MGGVIRRHPAGAAERDHDLVVVGGGIHGAMVALEAARRGYRPLLLERRDFGGATTWSHLRILHGGLRYLQGLDLVRFRESVRERRWWSARFPELVAPLPCLMPLYGDGLRRPAVLRAALALNDLLSWDRNHRVPEAVRVPPGRVVSPVTVVERFPDVPRDGLRGGALWHDVSLERPQRLVMEVLRWACAAGATCLNYVEATGVERRDGRVSAVVARDRAAGEELAFRTRRVVNCAGPWARGLARELHEDHPPLFRPSLAFNLLLEVPAPSPDAVAVEPDGGRTYFLRPWRGRLMAGTFHAPRSGLPEPAEEVSARPEEVEAFLGELRRAVPALNLERERVVREYAGLLPVEREGTVELTDRPVILDHGSAGGPDGLVSVSGVKLTTARAVAIQVLRSTFGGELRPRSEAPSARVRPPPAEPPSAAAFLRLLEDAPPEATARLRELAEREAVVRPEDLLWRRTDWSEDLEFAELRARVPSLLSESAEIHDPSPG